MSLNIYDINVLVKVVEQLKRPAKFFLDRFFPEVDTQDSLKISFDIDENKPTIAPYVSPYVAGKILKDQGHVTKTFQPAYVKPKEVIKPSDSMRRAIGERIGGGMSPAERLKLNLRRKMENQIAGIVDRCELQAVEAMRTGQIIVTGEDYPTMVVDFGRDAALTVDISGGAAEWGDDGISPLKNVHTWASLVLQKSGATVTDVVMDPKAWELFAADPIVKERLDTRRVESAGPLALGKAPVRGARYMGTLDNFDFWQYQDWYRDLDGTDNPYLPDYTVILSGPQLEGVRIFGAILDEEAGMEGPQAMEYFPKSWLDKDPPVRYLMTQSAPLMVPYRINASLCATVKA